MVVTLENNLAVPQKVKFRFTILPSNTKSRYIPKISENICPKDCTRMFIETLFIIAPKWKKHRCLRWWMDKQNMVYLYNGILFGNRKEWSTDATIWMKPESITLSERSQSQKNTYVWFHLFEKSMICKSVETESSCWLPWAGGYGRIGSED